MFAIMPALARCLSLQGTKCVPGPTQGDNQGVKKQAFHGWGNGLRVTEPGAHSLRLQTLSPALPTLCLLTMSRGASCEGPLPEPPHTTPGLGGYSVIDAEEGSRVWQAQGRSITSFMCLSTHAFIHSFIHHHRDATSDQESQGISAAGQGLSTGDNLPRAKAQSFPDPKAFPQARTGDSPEGRVLPSGGLCASQANVRGICGVQLSVPTSPGPCMVGWMQARKSILPGQGPGPQGWMLALPATATGAGAG